MKQFVCAALMGLSIILLATACEGDASAPQANASATDSASPPSPSPEVTRPPKPRPQTGRLEGTFALKYLLIQSDIPDSAQVEQHRWKFMPSCREGGSCNARVESLTNDWKATASWRGGLYRWARSVKKAYTCGSGGSVDYNIDATYEYSIRGQKVRWDGENWVISSFRGTVLAKGLKGCGLSGPPQQKWAILGRVQ